MHISTELLTYMQKNKIKSETAMERVNERKKKEMKE